MKTIFPNLNHEIYLWLVIPLFGFFIRGDVQNNDTREFTYNFTSSSTSYSYSAIVSTHLSSSDAANLLFSKNAVRYLSDFSDSIHFTDIDSISHIAEIRIQKWFYTGFWRYKRVLHAPDSLTIDLEAFRHNSSRLPRMKKIAIRYYFTNDGNGCIVKYTQTTIVDKRISKYYKKIVRKQLDHFAGRLIQFIRTNEHRHGEH